MQEQIPANVDAEMSVLGAAMADAALVPELLSALKADDFYLGTHQAIYNGIAELASENKPVNMIMVREKTGISAVDIANIFNFQAVTVAFKHHCQIVKNASIRRKLIMLGKIIGQKAREEDNLDDVLSTVENYLLDITRDEASDY